MREIRFDKEKEVRSFWQGGMNLNAEEAICKAIRRTVPDIMARTLKIKAGQGWHLADRLTEKEDSLASRVSDYFAEDPRSKEAFDRWHHETCNYILDVLKTKYEVVHYGKAQKILNMTFKNLYCTRLGDREAHFTHCHMPMDSYTLEWTFRNVYPFSFPRPIKDKTPAWSNFSGAQTQVDSFGKYTYWYVTGLIEGYFNEYRTTYHAALTTLQAEFVIWKEIQLEMAAEGFYSQLMANLDEADKKEKLKALHKMQPKEKLAEVNERLAAYLSK